MCSLNILKIIIGILAIYVLAGIFDAVREIRTEAVQINMTLNKWQIDVASD